MTENANAAAEQRAPWDLPAKSGAGGGAPSRRPRNRKGQGTRLRAELLEAAKRVLARDGYAGLTLRAVAREARVTAPAIYLQFADLQALVWELLRLTWQELADEMQSADSAAVDQTPLERLEAQLDAYVSFATSSSVRYQLLFAMSPEPGQVNVAVMNTPTYPVYQVLQSAVARCHEAGYTMPFPPGGPPDLSTVLLFVVAHGRIALAFASQFAPFSTAETSRAFVAEVLHVLIGPPRDVGR